MDISEHLLTFSVYTLHKSAKIAQKTKEKSNKNEHYTFLEVRKDSCKSQRKRQRWV